MNLRLSSDALRFRVTQKELEELKTRGVIECETPISGVSTIKYAISLQDAQIKKMELSAEGTSVRLSVSRALLNGEDHEWRDEAVISESRKLRISLEVDVLSLNSK